ncbi:MAG: nonstructural protein [Microvirus sp.]|nr:MAG: nonstructural protein [Microvirus sp.]
MILNAYSVLDTKTGIYNLPFFMQLDVQALRAVADLGRNTDTTVGRYPNDYVLVRIGQYDDNTGSMEPHPPVNMGVISAIAAQLEGNK